MGTLNNKNIIQKYDISIKNDMVMHNNGKFVIVHQYDRIPEWKVIVEKEYD